MSASDKELDRKDDAGSVRSKHRAGDPHLLGRKSVLMGMLTSGFVIANVAQSPATAAGTVKPSPIAATTPSYVSKWAASTAYARGQQVISPDNDVVSANVSHTSSTAYVNDVAKWTLSSTYATSGSSDDRVMYVSAGAKASDSNNGLTWGSAKSTIGAAVTALGTNGTVMIGGGAHTVATPLPSVEGLTLRGAGRRSTTINVTASLFRPTDMDLWHLVLEGLNIVSTNGHIFDFSTRGMVHSVVRDCIFTVYGATNSVVYLNGASASFQENVFENCHFNRLTASLVPVFNIIDHIGAANGNVWRRCTAYGHNCISSPFWRIEAATTGTYCYDNTWQNIVGEQNRGGMIHLYSPQNCVIESVNDYDCVGNYTDDIIMFDRTAGGYPRGNRVAGSGPRGGAMNPDTYYFRTIAGENLVLERMSNALGTVLIASDAPYGRIMNDSGAEVPSMRILTSSDTANRNDAVLILNGASVTLTLPNPTTVHVGRQWTAKNINASAATVSCSGHTIDGAASKSLAQWATATYVTDGVQWYVV